MLILRTGLFSRYPKKASYSVVTYFNNPLTANKLGSPLLFIKDRFAGEG